MTAETLKTIYNALDPSQKDLFKQWVTSQKQPVKPVKYKSKAELITAPENIDKLMNTLKEGRLLSSMS